MVLAMSCATPDTQSCAIDPRRKIIAAYVDDESPEIVSAAKHDYRRQLHYAPACEQASARGDLSKGLAFGGHAQGDTFREFEWRGLRPFF